MPQTTSRRTFQRTGLRNGANKLLLLSAVAVILCSVVAPTWAQPQPEFRTFSPAGKTELVDPFTGNFQYNITLFEVPGPNGSYPVNLSYRSGVTMEQDAGWVGLGWT